MLARPRFRTCAAAATLATLAGTTLGVLPAQAATQSTSRATITPGAQEVPAGHVAALHGVLVHDGKAVARDKIRFYREGAEHRLILLGATIVPASGSWTFRLRVEQTEVVEARTSARDGSPAIELHPVVVRARISDALGERAVALAAQKAGDPYVYGAAGPGAFDCSGLTKFVYGELGVDLPHNAAEQYDVVTHLSHAQMQPGDLIFFDSGSGIYHVGIYAGHDEIWHAPYSGTVVQLNQLWTSDFLVGRVR